MGPLSDLFDLKSDWLLCLNFIECSPGRKPAMKNSPLINGNPIKVCLVTDERMPDKCILLISRRQYQESGILCYLIPPIIFSPLCVWINVCDLWNLFLRYEKFIIIYYDHNIHFADGIIPSTLSSAPIPPTAAPR